MKTIYENDDILAIWHPQADYEIHILILPKQAILDFSAVDAHSSFWLALPGAVAVLVERFGLKDKGYRLITNCGIYQQIPQLHFHLVAGKSMSPDQGS